MIADKKIIKIVSGTILAAIAIFAVKADVEYAPALGLYVSTVNGGCLAIKTSPANFFSTIGTNQAAIRTSAAAGSRKLWATNTCAFYPSKPVYFRR